MRGSNIYPSTSDADTHKIQASAAEEIITRPLEYDPLLTSSFLDGSMTPAPEPMKLLSEAISEQDEQD